PRGGQEAVVEGTLSRDEGARLRQRVQDREGPPQAVRRHAEAARGPEARQEVIPPAHPERLGRNSFLPGLGGGIRGRTPRKSTLVRRALGKNRENSDFFPGSERGPRRGPSRRTTQPKA